MTSMFEVSSHLKTIPSRLIGKMHLAHWHPVEKGSAGGTIINTLSFLRTTPMTLTVLPSLMYLQKHNENSSLNASPWEFSRDISLSHSCRDCITSFIYNELEHKLPSSFNGLFFFLMNVIVTFKKKKSSFSI